MYLHLFKSIAQDAVDYSVKYLITEMKQFIEQQTKSKGFLSILNLSNNIFDRVHLFHG